MTTVVCSHDLSIYNGYKLVGGVAPNLNFKNTGTATLDTTLIFCLVKNKGQPEESITNFQCWVRKNIAPNDEINISGVYFLTNSNIDLILEDLNGTQTLQLSLEVTGGASEDDRTALTKQNYTEVLDYSLTSSII